MTGSTTADTKLASLHKEIATIKKHRGFVDLHVCAIAVLGTVGVGSALFISPLLSVPFIIASGLIYAKMSRGLSVAEAAHGRVDAEWKKFFPVEGLVTAAGEPVRIVEFDAYGTTAEVAFEDGQATRLNTHDLVAANGTSLVPPGSQTALKGALSRWSQSKWSTDDGRVGIVRNFRHVNTSENVFDRVDLLLKFEHGKPEWVNAFSLTPVA
jgi:hypothetical protein